MSETSPKTQFPTALPRTQCEAGLSHPKRPVRFQLRDEKPNGFMVEPVEVQLNALRIRHGEWQDYEGREVCPCWRSSAFFSAPAKIVATTAEYTAATTPYTDGPPGIGEDMAIPANSPIPPRIRPARARFEFIIVICLLLALKKIYGFFF